LDVFNNILTTSIQYMSLFRKFFGAGNDSSDEEKQSEFNTPQAHLSAPADEKFTFNFKKNGGKFLYCENLTEVKDHFENILEENDWFESEAACYEPKLFSMLDENKLTYKNATNLNFFCQLRKFDCRRRFYSIFIQSNQTKQAK
jgi:hypothetical protein